MRSAGEVTRGDAPPPFVPRVGGGDRGKRSQKGQPAWEWRPWAPFPALGCSGYKGPGAPLSPTRARAPALGPTVAAAPMPGVGERLQSVAEKRPPTSKRAQRQRRGSLGSEGRSVPGRRHWRDPAGPAWRASPRSPGEAHRLRGGRGRTCAIAPCNPPTPTPPPFPEPRQGSSRNSHPAQLTTGVLRVSGCVPGGPRKVRRYEAARKTEAKPESPFNDPRGAGAHTPLVLYASASHNPQPHPRKGLKEYESQM